MANLVKSYMTFYALGRDDEELDDGDDVDITDLADQVMKGTPVRQVVDKVAESLAAPLTHARERKEWVDEHADEITRAGGDADEAYRHYLQGRKDEYAHALEDKVIESLFVDDEEDDEDNDDDADDDDDDDDDAEDD